MAVEILYELPELRIRFNADIGNGIVGAARNRVNVTEPGGQGAPYWEVRANDNQFQVTEANGNTLPYLDSGPGGITVIDTDGSSVFLYVVLPVEAAVAAPSSPLTPIQQPQAPAQPATPIRYL